MKTAKFVLDFSLSVSDDFRNTPSERQAIFNQLRDELPEIQLNRVLIFTDQYSKSPEYGTETADLE